MDDNVLAVAIGGLLHDIGKVLYRYDDGRNHAVSGHDFLKDKAFLKDKRILDQVKYHHANLLKGAKIENDSLAYITYIADNIASMADRRKKDDEGIGFARDLPLDSIFNILNGNDEEYVYPQRTLEGSAPVHPTKNKIKYSEEFYGKVIYNISDSLNGLSLEYSYVNSLLEVLEANLSFIPSSTSLKEIADISLFDHVKITAAIGCCIYQYLNELREFDYHNNLFLNTKEFYEEKAFLLYSVDISGIQDFIYTIPNSKALKNLRARSFYLELLMEHIVDELLNELELSRVNLIYCGGGHAYLLIANTETAKDIVDRCECNINKWFIENFGTALYIAGGYSACSAFDLQNNPKGSYSTIFKTISNEISNKKSARYSTEDILNLNNSDIYDDSRECKVCHVSNKLNRDDKCPICSGLEDLSTYIQDRPFFTVVESKRDTTILPLPNNKYLVADTMESLKHNMKKEGYIRTYSKNDFYTGYNVSSKIWVGDYQNGDTLSELANASEGIKRLGVIRADIDNLGYAFVSGFDEDNVSLSRTATFSRKLSIFFKRNVNYILRNPSYYLHDRNEDGEREGRKATIVYSGGDDLFIIGAWDEAIALAIDIKEELEVYSQGMLTISAGIGLYPEKYPISNIARETGQLESCAKQYPNKNAITIFDSEYTYGWDDFIDNVYEDKFRVIYEFFEQSEERGKGFLYKLVDYMRNVGDKINLSRFAYLLARLEPDASTENQEEIESYTIFARKMYEWIRNKKDCKEAILAIYLYVYLTREREGE